jgi:hypothetical protein
MNTTNILPKTAEPHGLSTEDLIDRIAKRLPDNVRADYYRLVRHCRSLPQNDEVLLVLNAMQFLMLLIVEVPDRMAVEREKLERLFERMVQVLEKALRSLDAHQKQIDQQLAQLPEKIAEQINPEAIAARILESFQQQFERSTIPETAELMAATAQKMETAEAKFESTAKKIGDSCYGAVADARRAVDELRTEADGLPHRHWRLLYAFVGLALGIGLVLGALIYWWVATPAQAVDHVTAPQVQPAHEIPRPNARPVVRPKTRP